MNKISDKEFIEILDLMKSQVTTADAIDKVIIKECPGLAEVYNTNVFLNIPLTEKLIGVLEVMFEDSENWTSWWVEDSQFGEYENVYSDADDKVITPTNNQEFVKFLHEYYSSEDNFDKYSTKEIW